MNFFFFFQKELLSYNARNAPEGAATDLRAVGSNANLRQGTTRMPTSCLDLKAAGFYLNGIYPVVGAQHIELVHCDFSKLTFDPSNNIRHLKANSALELSLFKRA